jgi:protein gp37
MGASNIEWTDTTWNPTVGCSKPSAGCKFCYAEVMGKRLRAMALADIAAGKNPGRKANYIEAVDERGRWTGKVPTIPAALADPLGWKKPRRVFVNSMSDLFHVNVPFEFIAAVFGVMAATPQHTYQVLTKRPERAAGFFRWALRRDAEDNGGTPGRLECCWQALRYEAMESDAGPLHTKHAADPDGPWPLPNVWLGTSVENQETADERIPHLLKCPSAVRFISYEPALGPVRFALRWPHSCFGGDAGPVDGKEGYDSNGCPMCKRCGVKLGGSPGIGADWVIVGGESGPGARPFNVKWARTTIAQCADADVACFVKQLGSRPVVDCGNPGDAYAAAFARVDDMGNVHLKDKKGGDMAEWPDRLRVREWPHTP